MRDTAHDAIEGLMLLALILISALIGGLGFSWATAQAQRITALETQLALIGRQQHDDHVALFGH